MFNDGETVETFTLRLSTILSRESSNFLETMNQVTKDPASFPGMDASRLTAPHRIPLLCPLAGGKNHSRLVMVMIP
jgi:hypothetical protein